ncbi:MAG: universal stress protein [Calothrix sp. C42_A2020_038]|nr:universal stress protein [Calothrix sp. C42_A2020_038]
MHRRILVALENNQIGNDVFREALSFAKISGARLMLLHVMSPFDERYINPVSIDPYSYYPAMHSEAMLQTVENWEKLKQDNVNFLNKLCSQATFDGITSEFTQSVGDPGQSICEVASNWQADLIIVGRRGRTGLSEFFLGSVSNYVLHHAPCSVLTIQKKQQKTKETFTQPETTEAAVR